MGRWFPDLRRGSREQVREFDKAHRALNENSDREHREWKAAGRKGGVPESERYLDLNDRASRAARPLSPLQRTPLAHDMRETRTQLRERREQRQQRRADRGRGAR